MKKYCLTQCFKRKMSETGEFIVGAILTIIVLLIGMAILAAISGGIGWLWLTFMNQPIKDPIGTGVGIVVVSVVIGFVTYWLSKAGAYTTVGITGFVKKRYEGEPYQCSIFEECTEEN